MKVGDLRKILADPSIGDDVVVLVPGYDHSYREVYASIGNAQTDGYGTYSETYDDVPLDDGNRVVKALIVGD